MIDSVGDVEAVRQLDLWLLFEFLGNLYFELELEICLEHIRHSENALQKVSNFLKKFKKLILFV